MTEPHLNEAEGLELECYIILANSYFRLYSVYTSMRQHEIESLLHEAGKNQQHSE